MSNVDTTFKELDVEALLEELDLDEKISLLSGIDFWHTKGIPRLKIPSLRTSDGPNGVRGTRFFKGVPAACFPCGTGLAATWDTALIKSGGQLQGKEAIAKGAHVILGPTTNMQRSPLGGRGFESFSEDPYLAGAMTAATVTGIQSTGVAATVKHFVCNDQEDERQAVNSILTERALREIYLMPFQIAQRDAKPLCYMTAYNKVNDTHVSESPKLLTDILRKEWGFNGLVMSDWFGTYTATQSIKAGLDLEMPGPPVVRKENVHIAIRCGQLASHLIDERVRNVLNLVNRVGKLNIPENAPETTIDSPETAERLRDTAAAGIVLCKNNDNVLPFDPAKTIAVIGPNAKVATYSGGGSASLLPYYARTPFEGITAQAKDVKYTLGAIAYKNLPQLAPETRTKDGQVGMIGKVYNEPPSSSVRNLVDEIHIDNLVMLLADYYHPKVNPDLFYMDLEGTITVEEDCDFEFGVAVCGTAKLYVDGELVVDNATHQRIGENFFSAGTEEERGVKHLKGGQTYSLLLQWGSSITQTVKRKGATVMASGGIRLGGLAISDSQTNIAKAVALAKEVDQVIICAGLNSEFESEGYDRPHMDLPGTLNDLIAAVSKANPRTAVVMQSGTPVSMPWIDSVPALMQAWYGGNETGNAIADVLFGKVCPSGKLPLSFPIRNEDNPAFLNYKSERGRALYGEDVYVGYRFYEKIKRDVLFPFGHGLSYTTFNMSGLKVVDDGTTLTATVDVENTGACKGAQVVQVYVSQRESGVGRPVKELKGFAKLDLEPGESKEVTVEMQKKYAASWWDEERDAWIMEKGVFDVLVGDSSAKADLKGEFEVAKTVWWNGL
ncbi:beta-glucosidase [Pseudovirgaria hyperparasitica]|uniref:beta-glucosidase n=1 Tax=Pseudovirgaria hyperparasitica TaxID=470096 RepID=A0A6A6W3H8_9PEZI|nr:beta-glucosidase [Pseudovirgaria hyperparasitica]KAF2755591.1 beta-glucosidase [Pseudovirgaria hyperparasitica]